MTRAVDDKDAGRTTEKQRNGHKAGRYTHAAADATRALNSRK